MVIGYLKVTTAMSDTTVSIQLLDWTRAKDLAMSIRNRVFIEEQNIAKSDEYDGQDDYAIHVIAIINGKAVGTARMQTSCKIGRLAVLKPYRNSKVATKILEALIREAKQRSLGVVYLHSQIHAVDFYHKLGFSTKGEPFMEAGIEHVLMQKNIG